ncbi:MAG: hypothetical protein WA184_19875, partial [Stellaceae bacterium]
LGRVGLDLVAAIETPHNESHAGRRGVAKGHRRAVVGVHDDGAPIPIRPLRKWTQEVMRAVTAVRRPAPRRSLVIPRRHRETRLRCAAMSDFPAAADSHMAERAVVADDGSEIL